MPQETAEHYNYEALSLKLNSLHIYVGLADDPVIARAIALLDSLAEKNKLEQCIVSASVFLNALIKHGQGLAWRDYLIFKLITDVNPFSTYFSEKQSNTEFGLWLTEACALDLSTFQDLAMFSLEHVTLDLRIRAIAENNAVVLQRLQDVPTWPRSLGEKGLESLVSDSEAGLKMWQLFRDSLTEPKAWQRLAKALSYFHSTNACGNFCFNRVFKWTDGSEAALLPVAAKRQMQDHSLYDYTQTLEKLSTNTARFLRGESAENALLYGPRGTGKSSSVRLMIRRFAKSGLRLIEVQREQLSDLPKIFERIHALSMRFVIFIDDLSFDEMNDDYTLFKNILDGSVLKQPDNVLIYVTSNRRHLVSENFTDTDNALYANDVRSERLSLSERFGLRLRFVTPNKDDYLKLIRHVLAEQKIVLTDGEREKMEQAALSDSANEASMTPRNALRFIRDYLAKGEVHVH